MLAVGLIPTFTFLKLRYKELEQCATLLIIETVYRVLLGQVFVSVPYQYSTHLEHNIHNC